MRLVWVNGSFGCRTIAARTRDLILDIYMCYELLQQHTYPTVGYLFYCDFEFVTVRM